MNIKKTFDPLLWILFGIIILLFVFPMLGSLILLIKGIFNL